MTLLGDFDDDIPEFVLSDQRIEQILGDIKRNSRNRRIALFAPVVLAAAVVGAMIAAPPRHGGLALTADAEANDPQLPQVFGSNGVWRLAEPIDDSPSGDAGPASVIEVPTEPSAPDFTLSPPDQEELQSLPTSTSTPPTSTSGQSQGFAGEPTGELPGDPTEVTELDPAEFSAEIRVAPAVEEAPVDAPATAPDAVEPDDGTESVDPAASSTPDTAATAADTTTPDDVSAAGLPQDDASSEGAGDQPEANPSTPTDDPTDRGVQAFSAPATIVARSVLVYSAHVSVAVQVVDDDSSVIDWCNTRVDWGDGSVTRVAGADDAALCTASCEREAASSAASSRSGIDELVVFEHEYTATIDASPRIFVATGDGCSYTLAELQLSPFTVVPLP